MALFSEERQDVRPSVACPQCAWHPAEGDTWICAPDGCGQQWDTFATAARCPGCEAQFSWTMCLSCGRVSPHKAWYLVNGESTPRAS